MIRYLVLLFALGLAAACGGPQRPPNDEVTTRMTSADEAALDGDQSAPADTTMVAPEPDSEPPAKDEQPATESDDPAPTP